MNPCVSCVQLNTTITDPVLSSLIKIFPCVTLRCGLQEAALRHPALKILQLLKELLFPPD